ncbi:MAG: hypothetical protein WC607_01490 [Candidatus Micrarchaeia archaeon]
MNKRIFALLFLCQFAAAGGSPLICTNYDVTTELTLSGAVSACYLYVHPGASLTIRDAAVNVFEDGNITVDAGGSFAARNSSFAGGTQTFALFSPGSAVLLESVDAHGFGVPAAGKTGWTIATGTAQLDNFSVHHGLDGLVLEHASGASVRGGSFYSNSQSGLLVSISDGVSFSQVNSSYNPSRLEYSRVRWLDGFFEEMVFADEVSRLERAWSVRFEFSEGGEPAEAMLSVSDYFGDVVYSSSAPEEYAEFEAVQAVYGQGFSGVPLNLGDEWTEGARTPHSYSAVSPGGVVVSGKFEAGAGEVGVSFAQETAPSAYPGSLFTIQAPSNIIVNPQVTIYVDLVLNGKGACGAALSVGAALIALESCDSTTGRHAFLLSLTEPGTYELIASYAGQTAKATLNVVGQPPLALPDHSVWSVLFLLAVALFALRKN